jgi:hypothetical protein
MVEHYYFGECSCGRMHKGIKEFKQHHDIQYTIIKGCSCGNEVVLYSEQSEKARLILEKLMDKVG